MHLAIQCESAVVKGLCDPRDALEGRQRRRRSDAEGKSELERVYRDAEGDGGGITRVHIGRGEISRDELSRGAASVVASGEAVKKGL